MKQLFLLAIVFSSVGDLFAQRDCSLQKDSLTNEMFLLMPDQKAEPDGGMRELFKAIGRIKIPAG